MTTTPDSTASDPSTRYPEYRDQSLPRLIRPSDDDRFERGVLAYLSVAGNVVYVRHSAWETRDALMVQALFRLSPADPCYFGK